MSPSGRVVYAGERPQVARMQLVGGVFQSSSYSGIGVPWWNRSCQPFNVLDHIELRRVSNRPPAVPNSLTYVTCAVLSSSGRISSSRKGKTAAIAWRAALSTASRVCTLPDLPNSKKSDESEPCMNDSSYRVASIHMDSSSRVDRA